MVSYILKNPTCTRSISIISLSLSSPVRVCEEESIRLNFSATTHSILILIFICVEIWEVYLGCLVPRWRDRVQNLSMSRRRVKLTCFFSHIPISILPTSHTHIHISVHTSFSILFTGWPVEWKMGPSDWIYYIFFPFPNLQPQLIREAKRSCRYFHRSCLHLLYVFGMEEKIGMREAFHSLGIPLHHLPSTFFFSFHLIGLG